MKMAIKGAKMCQLKNATQSLIRFALIEGCRSQSRELKCGVPHGSVIGLIVYVLYRASLADILRFHEMQFHFYVDDTQLYISFSTNNDVELTNSITKKLSHVYYNLTIYVLHTNR